MTEPRARPEVVAFDVDETLLDVAPVRAALIELGQPGDLLPAVFARTLLTGFVAATVGSWCPFRAAFEASVAQLTELPTAACTQVADAFMELSPHPDVEPALRRLAEAGVRAVTLSHGSPGVAEAALSRGGVATLVERTLTSESIQAWKPNREAYLWAAGVCDVAPDRMALVAAHSWDVLGAQRAGLTAGFTSNRAERVYAAVFDPPHVQGSLVEVVDALLVLPPAG
ncbi:2-haloacid dehalogenase [Modestobacter sp. DSM 44400]|uniref:HAD-IA family hydrolase n=1 Tax=Modestobacter sp. DSM 44400 TaxID=1550230 RepID=UPI000899959E|nr:HAD-IA family hydrolase [Modestobacter sp. DSM 44400]SDY32379.1 2-haloacid dehalogenase [Modestobacter sp. DSM 44400]